ncbi:MAG: DUF885 domain-containing protein [Erysipelotrichaceae bacterium]|nr:DUF885 domain-containing protein [Erysipelotrichaceae bacterium]
MKKLVMIVMLAMMLVSCTTSKKSEIDDNGPKYLEKLRSFETRQKDMTGRADNKEFDAFLDKVFVEGMGADFMTMHFSVIDYKKYGIEKPPVDLGEISYSFPQKDFDYMEGQLEELLSFDYDTLSYRQQYDYEALEYSLYETLASYAYYPYSFLFTSGSNLAENLISNFTDYTFYDEESVEDYLACLADVDRYFDDALEYTEKQSKDGLGMIDPWIDYTHDTCEGMLNKKEDNALITTFDERMEDLDFLTEAQKENYRKQNRELVLNEVLPAYEKVDKEVEKYRGKKKTEDYALYKLNKDYAELTYYLVGSNNEPIDEVFQELKDNISTLEATYVSCFYDQIAYGLLQDAMNGMNENLELVNRDCLEYLRTHLNVYYPDLGEVEYDIQELDPDTAPATAIAYYWPSPIDNSNQNIIRTNPNNMIGGFETYGTLSHEGFPGHLYQHVYYHRTDPHNFRSVIGFGGYTEGWAVDAQYYAYRFSGIDNDYAAMGLFIEDAWYFFYYSLIDLATNYYGWSAKEIADYFEKESMLMSLTKEDAHQMMDFVVEMPGVYCTYGLGASSFMTLCERAKSLTGEKFDYVAYHDALLKNGPLPFNILEEAVNEYIAASK